MTSPVQLTAGAAMLISRSVYCLDWEVVATSNEQHGIDWDAYVNGVNFSFDARLDAGQRITMQVVGIGRLKYSISRPTAPTRVTFQSDESIYYAHDDAYWGDRTPYRLLLSDGAHVVVGNFYSESTTHATKASGKIHAHVHKLVVSGQLREGTIISFVPNCHFYNYGNVTIFRLKVEGWQQRIGNPAPCHAGVTSYSSAYGDAFHNCINPVPSSQVLNQIDVKPINAAVALLVKVIQEIYGYCCVSGSAALTQYLHTLPGCDHCYEKHYSKFIRALCRLGDFSNDVDIFVPRKPDDLRQFYTTGNRVRSEGGLEFCQRELETSVFPMLYRQYGIRHSHVTATKIRLSKVEEELSPLDSSTPGTTQQTEDYGWMRIFVGLQCKLDFNLLSQTGELLTPKPISILVVDAFPRDITQSWGKLITDSFDADVVKCSAEIDPCHNNTSLPVVFNDDNSLQNIMNGRFEYTMMPCHSFPQMMKRLTKYQQRGFKLSRFSFDERVSQEWKDHIMNEFRLKYAGYWLRGLVEGAGLSLEGNDLPRIARMHIFPYLGRFDGDDLSDRRDIFIPDVVDRNMTDNESCEQNKRKMQAVARGMIRRNIIAELEKTGYRDPGHALLSKERLIRGWKNIDSLPDGVCMDSFWHKLPSQFPSLVEAINRESSRH